MAKSTVSPEALTGVALAIAVMSEAAKAEGQAVKTLEKKKGASWLAVQEAAGAFDASMSADDKRKLSSELARVYRTYYPESSAKVVASQHARAIHALAHGAPVGEARNIADFIKSLSKKPETGESSGGGATPASTAKPASVAAISGATIEVQSAIARLVAMAAKIPGLEDALCVAANHPDEFMVAMEALIMQRTAPVKKAA